MFIVILIASAIVPAATAQPHDKLGKKTLSAGDKIAVGGRDYSLRFVHDAVVGRVEKRGAICLSHGGTTWVINPLLPDLKDHFAFPWPVETLSADRSLAIVRVPSAKGRLAVADVRKKTLVAEFDGNEEAEFFNVNPGDWVFSQKRRRVYPLNGIGAGGWFFLDLVRKKRVAVEVAGFRPRNGVHVWNGALLDGGQDIVLFVTGGDKRDGRRRVQFPIDEMEKRTVAAADTDVIWVLDASKDQLTAYLGAGTYALVSTNTWKVIQRFDWPEQVRSPLMWQRGPAGRHAYFINDLHRLVVYEPRTSKLVKILLDSQETEARALAVTFAADGRHGAVAAHGVQIAVFDTDRHEIVHQFAVKRTPSIAFLIEPARKETLGTCLIVD
ncbi:MAG: hypothetical protein L0Y71_10795 [Gemmataceae bacterium]|nr:hypothetical protein [Gemmataceae bacterium]